MDLKSVTLILNIIGLIVFVPVFVICIKAMLTDNGDDDIQYTSKREAATETLLHMPVYLLMIGYGVYKIYSAKFSLMEPWGFAPHVILYGTMSLIANLQLLRDFLKRKTVS